MKSLATAAGLAEIIDRDDVRVVESREHAGFAAETLGESGVARQRLGENLERDEAFELSMARFVHGAHAAGANQL